MPLNQSGPSVHRVLTGYNDRSRLLENDLAMRCLAQDYCIPCIEMHHHFSEHYDQAFLWRSQVRLTSFGQKFFASKRYVEVTLLLK